MSWVPTEGMVVADRYRLISPLGQGGMGAVWRAEHQSLRSPVAVKLLNPAIAGNADMLERFLREAQSAAALRSTHVVQVFDYGVHDGIPFIAMELLNGQSLGARLSLTSTIHPKELAWIFMHVSRAIARAHELGITHRDLKPDNIFLVQDGEVELAKVLDFGIAKVADSAAILSQSSGNTRTGTVLGTPFYMSPEQARGNRAVDYRADLWALGIIAFECVTGRLPFISSALGDLVIQICTQPTPTASAFALVPPGFDQWFIRSCQKDPELRFQSVREQNDALQVILNVQMPAHVDVELRNSAGLVNRVPGGLNSLPTASTNPPPISAASSVHQPRLTTNSAPVEVPVRTGSASVVLVAVLVALTFGGGILWVAFDPKAPEVLKGAYSQASGVAASATSSEVTAAAPTSSGVNTIATFEPTSEAVASSVPSAAPRARSAKRPRPPQPPAPAAKPQSSKGQSGAAPAVPPRDVRPDVAPQSSGSLFDDRK